MPQQKKSTAPRISEMEWEILKPLWENGPMAARDIFQHVSGEQEWAYKTVKTMLARLVKKGLLTYTQVGNSYLYTTAFTRDEVTRAATGNFIERVFGGALRPFLAQFVDQASEEEIKVLRAELTRVSRKREKGK